jgi:stearoyl-CoA desaturase (delta-9 desaturase)
VKTSHKIMNLFGVLAPFAGLAVPFGLGYALDVTLAGALTAALWGGAVRIFFWLSLLSLGESWHHNHHAFPRSAVHGLRWWEVDPTAWAVRALRRMKLAWNVVEISPERQRQRESRPAPRAGAPA